MRLVQLRLRNFRCYNEEVAIDFDDLTALIGRNDSGKSTILEALDIFFNDTLPDKNDACKHGDPKDLTIIAIFSELPASIVLDQDAETTLQSEYLLNAEGKLEIHKVFNGSLDKPKMVALKVVALHPTSSNVKDLVSLNNPELKKRAEQVGADTSQIDKKVNAQLRAAIRTVVENLELKIAEVSLLEGNGANFWKGIQFRLPVFALFRSDRTSTDQDPEAQDPLASAIKEAIRKHETELNAIQQFVEQEVKNVADLTLDKLKSLDPNLANSLNPECTVKPWSSLFKVNITGDGNIPINKRGSGVRRLILLNFLRAKAELLRKEKNKQDLIYAIEEPETSQHPRNQRLLMSALQDLSCTEQVVITTHTPMLARVIAAESLRFVNIRDDGTREILTGGSDATNALIANSLGVLADHNVKLFIAVEGKTDIPFLKNMAKVLINAGEDVPDLEKLEVNGKVIFIPCGGTALALWSNRLGPINRPEFHIYDRNAKPPAPPTCIQAVNKVNSRNACKAVVTQKREIENYIHFEAINLALSNANIPFKFTAQLQDFDDVPTLLLNGVNPHIPSSGKWGGKSCKRVSLHPSITTHDKRHARQARSKIGGIGLVSRHCGDDPAYTIASLRVRILR